MSGSSLSIFSPLSSFIFDIFFLIELGAASSSISFMLSLSPPALSRSGSSSIPSSSYLGSSLTLAVSSNNFTFLPFLASFLSKSSTDSSAWSLWSLLLYCVIIMFCPVCMALIEEPRSWVDTYWPILDFSMISRSFLISSSYYFKSASLGSWLILGLFLICLALEAYLSVVNVSS